MSKRLSSLAAVTAIFAVATFGAGFISAARRKGPVDQPIAFNHRKHAVENKMECSDCHTFYQTEAFSGLPDASTCAMCHQEPQGKSSEERKLVALIRDEKPLEWKRLFRQPPHIYYSHRLHVMKAGIRCETCHGAIAMASTPPRQVKRLTMSDCIACHQRRNVATDCTTCHR